MRRISFKDLNRSPARFWGTAGFCFVLFFLLNEMTPYIADDFIYMFSFDTGARIEHVADILPSMYRHAYVMNGRLLPHALEQLFLMMPKHVFNLCSSAVFLWVMVSAYSVCRLGKEHSILLFLAIVMCFWNYVPAFGQVCLWQVGTINYLWAIAFCMFYLRPYLALYFGESPRGYFRSPARLWSKALFVLLAFLFGTYSEISSFVGIVLSVGILFACPRERRRGNLWLVAPIVAAIAGMLVLFRMPAEHHKQGILTLTELLKRVPDVTLQVQQYLSVLFIAWAILITLSFSGDAVHPSRRLASLGFCLGAVAGSVIMIFAVDFPYRCMITSTYFMILACGVLLSDLLDSSFAVPCKAAVAVLSMAFAVNLICGVGDIGSAWRQQHLRDQQISQAQDRGDREITLSRIYYATKYSPFFEMKDLDRFDPDCWPNPSMAQYYGFDRVYGTNPVTGDQVFPESENNP